MLDMYARSLSVDFRPRLCCCNSRRAGHSDFPACALRSRLSSLVWRFPSDVWGFPAASVLLRAGLETSVQQTGANTSVIYKNAARSLAKRRKPELS